MLTMRSSALCSGKNRTISTKALWTLLYQRLSPCIDNEQECRAIIQQLLYHYLHLDGSDWIINSTICLTPAMQRKMVYTLDRLQKFEPLQYILKEAYFAGNSFRVTPAVLIPRKETEEWVTCLMNHITNPTSILDLGTGSGCIAITLKKKFPEAMVYAEDISQAALRIAAYNAKRLEAKIHLRTTDILKDPPLNLRWSLIVSNPPYVCIQEKQKMHPNVLNWEPHLALFVNNRDPLLFYKRISYLAYQHLEEDGILCLEINEKFGKRVVNLLHSTYFRQITLHRDMHGKERWVMALR